MDPMKPEKVLQTQPHSRVIIKDQPQTVTPEKTEPDTLFGKLTKGGVVRVGVKDDKLDLKYESASVPRLTDNKPPLLTAE